MKLCDIDVGGKCVVKKLCVGDDVRRRLLDIGLIENTLVECVGRSPMGDPSAYLIRGALIALRCDDCKKILVEVAP